MDEALAGDRDRKKGFRKKVHNSIEGLEFYIASHKSYRGVDGIYECGQREEGMSVAVFPYTPPKILFKGAGHLDECTEKSGVAFVAREQFAKPREVVKLVIDPDKEELGLAFGENEKKMVVESLLVMGAEEALWLKGALESKGEAGFLVPSAEESKNQG
ncbi:hypothetical protein NL676_036977 [Syzygium grande]|nr:hypothetical protein NL676_036977 [Syzygium grande]